MRKVDKLRDLVLQSRDAIELVAQKWRIPVLHILQEGPLRTSVIQGAMTEVSAKMLTQTLRGMERDGLLIRDVHTETQRVDYRLTTMGVSLIKPLRELCFWAEDHADERNSARTKFDAAQRSPSP